MQLEEVSSLYALCLFDFQDRNINILHIESRLGRLNVKKQRKNLEFEPLELLIHAEVPCIESESLLEELKSFSSYRIVQNPPMNLGKSLCLNYNWCIRVDGWLISGKVRKIYGYYWNPLNHIPTPSKCW